MSSRSSNTYRRQYRPARASTFRHHFALTEYDDKCVTDGFLLAPRLNIGWRMSIGEMAALLRRAAAALRE